MEQRITLAHGSGGEASRELIEQLFVRAFANEELRAMEDSALVLTPGGGSLIFSTDGFVVDPLFFPGGNIGTLAVCGTINDLAMRGAQPLALSMAMIIEEGFDIGRLSEIVDSMQAAAASAGATIVTGDTKVVPAGKADKLFITSAGIGVLEQPWRISVKNGRPGDVVLLSGTMADHGATVLCRREQLDVGDALVSDCAALNGLVRALLAVGGAEVHVLRDPTRGGVATTLNELARDAGVGIRVREECLPVSPAVRGACELLGLDPLYLANEGKLLALVAAPAADRVLAAMQAHPLGKNACILGEVVERHAGQVVLETRIGGHRIIDMLHGEPLPRIC
jgi:hydrogenase expression/formation protein HypE